MTLIKSISGIRGTLGGNPGENLTPPDIVAFAAAYGALLLQRKQTAKVVIGRDARSSGEMVSQLVAQTLIGLGIDVVDLGLATTPTVEIAVPQEKAGGGIIITASHNPKNWNALKFLNAEGEFISAEDGAQLLALSDSGTVEFATVGKLGAYTQNNSYLKKHIELILALDRVDVPAIQAKNFHIVVDPVNSVGALAIPPLLEALGCTYTLINGEPNGQFAHNPEPLPENLGELAKAVTTKNAHLGISVDPDVDRLALVCENGEFFGEEYTLVAVADYLLDGKPASTVSNLSSTRALRDITEKAGGQYFAVAVGEVNVVAKMKEVGALIGGEGNGGVIYPALHYGRDALVGIALFLSLLAKSGKPASFLLQKYPGYSMHKTKIQLSEDLHIPSLLKHLEEHYKREKLNTTDGLKIELEIGWIHLRTSNTEPILRIYTESHSEVIAKNLAQKIMQDIQEFVRKR